MDTDKIKTEAQAEIGAVKALPWKSYIVYALIVLGCLAAIAFAVQRFWPDKPIVAVPTVMPEAKKAVDVPKITVPGPKKIVIYDKEKLGKKIPLPPEIAKDPHVQPTATAQIPKLPYGGTGTSFINMSSGVSVISVTPAKRPIFEFGGKTGLGALGGVSTKGNVAVGYVSQPIVRVGAVTIGVAGGGGIIGVDGILGAVVHLSGSF